MQSSSFETDGSYFIILASWFKKQTTKELLVEANHWIEKQAVKEEVKALALSKLS